MDVSLYDRLDGQVALVTGANRGIGAEVARQLSDLGATVYAGSRDPAAVENDDLNPVALDVTDDRSMAAAVDAVAERSGRLDVLVNNAGVYGPTGNLASLAVDDVDETLDVNLRGPMLLTRAALPLLTAEEGGRVVNVSSGSGQFDGSVDSGHLPYGVSKAGLNAFTNGLASQYPGLFVNAVCPGWVRTEMGGENATRSVEEGAETPVWLARLRDGPSGRLWRDGEPQPW